MSKKRLEERIGSPKKICNAFLPNYQLRMNKIGNDGSGKANIKRDVAPSNVVWGVLWSIPEASRKKLDEAEGFHPGRHDSHYRPEELVIFDDTRVPSRAMAYVACQGRTVDGNLPVHKWYYDFICSGAVENSLPAEYIDTLKQIQII